MMKILINGTELTGEVFGSREFIQNAQRDTLTIKADATGSFDEFLSHFDSANEIRLVETNMVQEFDENGEPIGEKEVTETIIYTDYSIIFKRAIESELVTPETPDAPAVYKDVYVVGLAQKTYLEKQIEMLQQLLNQ
jgi:hypothetical protein